LTELSSAANGTQHKDLVSLTTDIVASYVRGHNVAAGDLPDLISTVFASLSQVGQAPKARPEPQKEPAVPIRKSVTPEYIVCLEDGKKLKMLKRHLRTSYGMSPDEYRARWNLPADYPMVAPVYANQRSEFAKKIGLGTKSVRRR
jgi:predicted transcriptional regulator